MPELSLNILDLCENSFSAGASLVRISISKQTAEDKLYLSIGDNGKGMVKSSLEKVSDPLYTTKEGKEWGLGIPFLKQTADLCDGSFSISSAPDSGTQIKITARLSHIDLPPLGDLARTIVVIISGHSTKDLSLVLRRDSSTYEFSTEIIRREVEEVSLTNPDVLKFIERDISDGLRKLGFMK